MFDRRARRPTDLRLPEPIPGGHARAEGPGVTDAMVYYRGRRGSERMLNLLLPPKTWNARDWDLPRTI